MPLPPDERLDIITFEEKNGSWSSTVVQFFGSPMLPSGAGTSPEAALHDLYRSAQRCLPMLDALDRPARIGALASLRLTRLAGRARTINQSVTYEEFLQRCQTA